MFCIVNCRTFLRPFRRHNRCRDRKANPVVMKVRNEFDLVVIFMRVKEKTNLIDASSILAREHVFSARLRCCTMMKCDIFVGSIDTIWIAIANPTKTPTIIQIQFHKLSA